MLCAHLAETLHLLMLCAHLAETLLLLMLCAHLAETLLHLLMLCAHFAATLQGPEKLKKKARGRNSVKLRFLRKKRNVIDQVRRTIQILDCLLILALRPPASSAGG